MRPTKRSGRSESSAPTPAAGPAKPAAMTTAVPATGAIAALPGNSVVGL